jgi:hypothetical protein
VSRVLALLLLWAAAAVSAEPPSPAPSPAVPAAPPSPAVTATGLVVEQPTGRFDETYAGSEIVHTFAVRNDGAKPVRIVEVNPNTAPTRIDPLPGPIPPGGRAEVTVRQGTLGRIGLITYRMLLKADDGLPDRRLALTGFLQSAYEPDLPILLGEAVPGGVVSLAVACREVERLDVLEVRDAPAFVEIDAKERTAEGAVNLRATLKPDAPLGLHTGTLLVRTNVPQQPEIAVPYRLTVFEDVAPEDLPVDLGAIRQGQPFEKRTRLRSRSGQPFEITGVDGAGPGVTVEAASCPDPAPGCRALLFKGVGPAPGGRLSGTVRVKLSVGRELALPYTGIMFGSETVVRDLGKVGDPPPAPPPPPALKAKPPTPPPVPPPVMGRPGERSARLTWDAGQEEQAYGFLIYRSDKREGPFRRVNPRIVRVSEGPPPHRYTYEDRDVEPGRSYFYYLESVSKGGVKARLSGVVTKVIPPAP